MWFKKKAHQWPLLFLQWLLMLLPAKPYLYLLCAIIYSPFNHVRQLLLLDKFHIWDTKAQKCKVAAKSLQLCPTLCDPIDGSPPGSPVPGILQARTPEWVAISFSNAWKWKVKVKSLSRVQLLANSWTATYQAPSPWDFPGKSTGVGCHCLLR